jgi:hypothetical protein
LRRPAWAPHDRATNTNRVRCAVLRAGRSRTALGELGRPCGRRRGGGWGCRGDRGRLELRDLRSSDYDRYLSRDELAAVLRDGVPDDVWGVLERPLYLNAAMTGMRQGVLLGLRWWS